MQILSILLQESVLSRSLSWRTDHKMNWWLEYLSFAHAAGKFTWAEKCIDYISHLGDLIVFSVFKQDFNKTEQNLVFLFLFNNTFFHWDSENFAGHVFRLSLDWDLVGVNIHLDLFVYFIFFAVLILKWCNFIFAQVHFEVFKIHVNGLL